jgi:hypothetical protein
MCTHRFTDAISAKVQLAFVDVAVLLVATDIPTVAIFYRSPKKPLTSETGENAIVNLGWFVVANRAAV